MMVRGFFRAAAGAVIVIGGLSACGSSDNQSDSKPATPSVVATCTTNEQWSEFPSHLIKTSLVAKALGVSETSVKNGIAGLATCDKAIKADTIGSLTNPPFVEIKDRGSRCLAVGTQEDPRNSTTTKIMAVCPGDSTVTDKV